jgi:hypothetical protein
LLFLKGDSVVAFGFAFGTIGGFVAFGFAFGTIGGFVATGRFSISRCITFQAVVCDLL